jgi:uncharacterized repeat protein (TIGR02543 family)
VGSTGDKTFYAKWTAVNYNIAYNLNDGTNGTNPNTYTIESAITMAAPTRAGYSFIGWYDNAVFSGSPVAGISAGSTGDKAFYARWLDSYAIIYHLDSGTNNAANPATYTIENNITLNPATRVGYTLLQ